MKNSRILLTPSDEGGVTKWRRSFQKRESFAALSKGVLLFLLVVVDILTKHAFSRPTRYKLRLYYAWPIAACFIERGTSFIFAKHILTPLAVRNPSGVTYSHTALDLLLQVSSKGVLLFCKKEVPLFTKRYFQHLLNN